VSRTFVCIAFTISVLAALPSILPHSSASAVRIGVSQSEEAPTSLPSFKIVPLETVSETSSNASIGDLNGDGCPDILLVKGRHWRLRSVVFFGDCKGHFTPGPPLPSPAMKSYSGSLADMTKSGHLDIVLSNDSPDPKVVLLNDGHGNFRIGGTYGDPHWDTRNAAVGDLTGDGYPDIVVANRMMPSYVCLNDGKLHFNCRPLEDSPSAATVAIGDIEGNGKKDIVYACRDSCQSLIYFNDGKGNFTRRQPWGPPHSSTRALALADFNGDGRLDIAACHESLGCFVYLNDGKGHFGPGILFETHRGLPYSMTTGDLLQRHRQDILVGHVGTPGIIYFNGGSGKHYQPMPFGDGTGAVYGMSVGDLNGDGRPDIVVARSNAPSFVMFNYPAKK
jgi:FG-GAP-like repeat